MSDSGSRHEAFTWWFVSERVGTTWAWGLNTSNDCILANWAFLSERVGYIIIANRRIACQFQRRVYRRQRRFVIRGIRIVGCRRRWEYTFGPTNMTRNERMLKWKWIVATLRLTSNLDDGSSSSDTFCMYREWEQRKTCLQLTGNAKPGKNFRKESTVIPYWVWSLVSSNSIYWPWTLK